MNNKTQKLLFAIAILTLLSNLFGLCNIFQYSRSVFIVKAICLAVATVLCVLLIIDVIKNKKAAKQAAHNKSNQ